MLQSHGLVWSIYKLESKLWLTKIESEKYKSYYEIIFFWKELDDNI